jgi:hypothetical protein
VNGVKIFTGQNTEDLELEIGSFFQRSPHVEYVDMKINVAQPDGYDYPITTIVAIYKYKEELEIKLLPGLPDLTADPATLDLSLADRMRFNELKTENLKRNLACLWKHTFNGVKFVSGTYDQEEEED